MFSFLKPGGVLVAVVSAGPFFWDDAKAMAFSNWFNLAGGSVIDLPTNSFKESGTGVRFVLVRIER
jgi:hypothetical protein